MALYIACGIFWSVLVICATILELNGKNVFGLWVLVVIWAFIGFPKVQ